MRTSGNMPLGIPFFFSFSPPQVLEATSSTCSDLFNPRGPHNQELGPWSPCGFCISNCTTDYSPNDLKGVIRGITIGVTRGEARSLDESSYMIVQYSDP